MQPIISLATTLEIFLIIKTGLTYIGVEVEGVTFKHTCRIYKVSLNHTQLRTIVCTCQFPPNYLLLAIASAAGENLLYNQRASVGLEVKATSKYHQR